MLIGYVNYFNDPLIKSFSMLLFNFSDEVNKITKLACVKKQYHLTKSNDGMCACFFSTEVVVTGMLIILIAL